MVDIVPDMTSARARENSMADMGSPEWLEFFTDACRLLWPAPAVITLESGGGLTGRRRVDEPPSAHDREYALIPGLHRPPIMAPADRKTVSAVVRYHTGTRSPVIRLIARLLSFGLAGGMGGALLRGRVLVNVPPGTDTIETYLSSVMSSDIRVSMQLGRPRANRKPVLQMLDAAGEPCGFVKIGINPLTRELVRAEHDSLSLLNRAELSEISVPRVLHYGTWQGLDVLVLSALPGWRGHRPLTERRFNAAVTELAGVNGLQRGPLAGSEYFRLLESRLAATDEGPERDAIRRALDALTELAGGTVLTFGSWHGDWAPWNMVNTGRGLLVWDWERFTGGVPLGYDALHYWLQAAAARTEPRLAASRCLEQAERLLTPVGVPRQQAQLTAILYLTDLATRYITDRQAQAGARLGATGTWLIPVIAGGVARMRDAQTGPRVTR